MVTKRSSRVFITQDPVVDFHGEMQIMNDDLTRRDGYAVAAVSPHVTAVIVEKWWRRHLSDFDGGANQALGHELQGENLGLTSDSYTLQCDVLTS